MTGPRRDPEPKSCDRPRSDLRDAAGFRCERTLLGHEEMVTSIKFAPGGLKFASGSADGTARMWDTERGEEVAGVGGRREENKEQIGAITGVDVNRGGFLVATSSDDFKARIWDTRAPKAPVQEFRGHTHVVSSCCFSPSGMTIATGSFDETVRLWDTRMGVAEATIAAHSQPVTCVKFSTGSIRPNIATTSLDGTCRIWTSHSRECIRTIVPTNDKGERAPVASVNFTPNNRYVLMNSLHSKILLYDPLIDNDSVHTGGGTGQAPVILPVLKKTYEGHVNKRISIQSVFMTSCEDGSKLVLSGSEDHHVYVWSLNDRELLGVLRGVEKTGSGISNGHMNGLGNGQEQGHCDAVIGIDASESAPVVVTGGGSKDRSLKVWRRE